MNLIFLLTGLSTVYSQPATDTSVRKYYEESFDAIESEIGKNGSFKKAVFYAENAFYQHQLSAAKFDLELNALAE
jgi:hypothetical protein